MKKLISFLCSITKQLKQSRKGDGINCYDIEAITKHKAKIERLCTTCGWRLSHFASKESYDPVEKEITSSTESYYLGPQIVDSEDDLLEAFTQ